MPIRFKISNGAVVTEESPSFNQPALLKELVQSDPKSDRARQILDSLRKYKPKSNHFGTTLVNPVTGIRATATPYGASSSNTVVFDSLKTGFRRPKTANSALDQLGIRATINQAINELPTRAQSNPGRSNQYDFEPLKDRGEKKEGNQRASAYRRATRGAFDAQPRKDGTWRGVGARIDQDTWQPRNARGQFGKYVKFNPVTQDNILPRIGKQIGAMATKRALGSIHPFAQGVMAADDLIEGITGYSPAELTVKGSQKTLEDMYEENPEINIGPILPF